jgi:3-deoxy-manno-octulosonate cytidylyltransferase (CMP-KDO synthetase)
MASTRLPGKPLADIRGEPMIVHVWRRALEADLGPVLVAAAEAEIVAAIKKAGGEAVLTRPDHPSGSDRIFEALTAFDPKGGFDAVVNLQGDLPTLDPGIAKAAFRLLDDAEVDIGTVGAVISRPEERDDPNVVKAVVALASSKTSGGKTTGRALYFSRATVPTGPGPHFHHIGLYAYRRDALARFVALPPGQLEQRERLEQLRALENGMRIDLALVDTVPLGVDTPADLERARRMLAPAGSRGRP